MWTILILFQTWQSLCLFNNLLRFVGRILLCWQVIDEDASTLWAAMGLTQLLPSIHFGAIRLRLYVLTLTVSVQIKQLFIQHKVWKFFLYLIVWCNLNIHMKQQQLLNNICNVFVTVHWLVYKPTVDYIENYPPAIATVV